MDKIKLIKSLRFKFSLSFSIFLYLILYICLLFPVGKFRDNLDSFIFISIRVLFAFITSYFIIYTKKTLDKLIFENTKRVGVFSTQLFKHIFIGGLLWGIFAGGGLPGMILMTPIGAFLGLIYGFIFSIIILRIRKRVAQNHVSKKP